MNGLIGEKGRDGWGLVFEFQDMTQQSLAAISEFVLGLDVLFIVVSS